MFNIASYLEKFKKFDFGDRLLKEAILVSLKEVLNLNLKKEDIIFKNNEIILKTSPAIKNAIFVKKQLILLKIEEKTRRSITDIR